MRKAVLFAPSEDTINRSLDARSYVARLKRRLDLETRRYDTSSELSPIGAQAESVAVLAGLSSLELESGYVEMELDTVFRPQELLAKLRGMLPKGFLIVAIVDDAYSDYIMSAYLRAGASAVVGTSGDLFGLIAPRVPSWEQLFPYINAFGRG